MLKNKRVYFDFASTSPIDEEVISVVEVALRENFGNPSAFNFEGVKAKDSLFKTRANIASLINCQKDEIVFTSGGTESNNLAFWGFLNSFLKNGIEPKDIHLIVSEIEHSSILENAKEAKRKGFSVSFIDASENGIVSMSDLKNKLRKETVFVSIMKANNEIGVIQPTKEISKCIRHFGKINGYKHENILQKLANQKIPVFHSDWSQATLYEKFDALREGIDMATFDSQKIYGPKGVGCLFLKRGIVLEPIMHGGFQENGLRSGTENVPLILGFGKAFCLAYSRMEKDSKKVFFLREYLKDKILKNFKNAKINGDLKNRLPNNLNVFFEGMNADFLAITLDEFGFSLSTKSACLKGEDFSYVLKAISKNLNISNSSIRISLGRQNNKKEIDKFIFALKDAISIQKI